MSTTVSIPITIRNEVKECKLPATSGETYYHGSFVALIGTGYLKNFTSSLTGVVMVGILKDDKFEDQALGSTANPMSTPGVITATAAGDLSANTNCLNVYTYGEFVGTFESGTGLAVTDEGSPVYVVDNSTLTVNPSLGYAKIGRLTKYISATVGHVQLDSWNNVGTDQFKLRFPLTGATSGTMNVCQTVQNPFAFPVAVRGLDVFVKAKGGAVTGTACICPTSSGLAATTNIYTSSSISYATSNSLFTIAKCAYNTSGLAAADFGTDAATWATSAWLTLTESATTGSSMTGWWTATVQKL